MADPGTGHWRCADPDCRARWFGRPEDGYPHPPERDHHRGQHRSQGEVAPCCLRATGDDAEYVETWGPPMRGRER